MRRFYDEVSVGGDFSILLDGKPVKTPKKAKLVLPTRSLAEAVAHEWRSQGSKLVPSTMFLTKLSNSAIDLATSLREDMAAELLGFGKSDLLCYRAIETDELRARQEDGWDPLLDWAQSALGARLRTTLGVRHVEQDPQAIAALDRALRSQDRWVLTGLQTMTTITGSLVLALAMAGRRVTSTEAFRLSRIDEVFQAEKWGLDPEAEKRARLHAVELDAADKFIELARA